jgi:nucleotide-binding universal stress UspA family protein
MSLTEERPNSRFQHHVSFDNFAGGEATASNTISFTLNVKHKGYQFKRRSRTFMVGIDENDYSDIALQWMLEELVDDGDEIVCLRVVDKDAKVVSDRNVERRQYQKEAKDLMERIQLKNDDNRAISIILEFAVGKVHATFQKMVSGLTHWEDLSHEVFYFFLSLAVANICDS